MNSPLSHFAIKKIFNLSIFGYDVSFTNSSLSMLAGVALVCLLLALSIRKTSILPSRAQAFAELIYKAINDTLINSAGAVSAQFIPLIFTLFMFILVSNVLGLVPYFFTPTSHIIVTFALASVVFVFITFVGFFTHGLKFFSIFLPSGVPIFLAPLMIVIELFTYLGKPISLSLRLVANMVAGHILLDVLAGFIVILPFILKILPLPFVMILTVFEFGIAILQAYIFTILSCVYLNDALHLH